MGNFFSYKLISIGDYSLTLWSIISIFITIIITNVLLKIIKKILSRYAKRTNLDQGRFYSIFLIIKYFVWVISIVICLDIIGIKITLLLASGAALLVGLGFGLQNIFGDIVSGIAILFEGSIEIGDVIEVNKVIGKVKKISIRNTIVQTQDDYVIIVPNHKFISDNVINWSHTNNTVRFSINVGVAYGSDTKLVTGILLDCARKHTLLSKYPSPFVRFNDFGESALQFQLFFWCKEVFVIENVKSDLRYMIDKKFREFNIQIPFPQRDIHIKNS